MIIDTSWYSIKISTTAGATSDPFRLVLCPGVLAVQSWSTLESMLKWPITSGAMSLYYTGGGEIIIM